MHIRHLIAGLALLVGTAGCSSGSHTNAVEVHGTIQTVGGPAPGAPMGIAGARFKLVGNEQSVSVQADKHGRFGVQLAPGTYQVEITGHAPTADGRPLPARPGHIHVLSGSSAPVHLFVDIK
jgi:hypothetical protein